MKNIFLTLVLGSISLSSFSQSGRLKFANKQFDNFCYAEAASAYEDVLARKVDSSVVADKIAISYDNSGQRDKAVIWYRYLNDKDMLNQDGLMRLALLERRMERYPESDFLLELYSARYGKCDVCDNILSQKMNFEKLEKGKDNFTLQKEFMNTSESEMASGYFSDKALIIASSKRSAFAVKRLQSWTGDYFYDLYLSDINSENRLGKMKRIKGKVRSKYNEGTVVYHQPSGYLYFTRNNFLKGKKVKGSNDEVNLNIYRAKYDGKKFKNVESLSINAANYSTAHPAISKDGSRLYFSSNRPGGFGGMDLYYVSLDQSGNITSPEAVNLGGKINTLSNEVFPYAHPQADLLLFSSEGHFGYGGLDVYFTTLDKNGNVRKATNVGAPINSPYDDFSFSNNGLQTYGYFSSNRPLSIGRDDVFGFVQNNPFKQEIIASGVVRDRVTNDLLLNTLVFLKTSDGIIVDSILTDAAGAYRVGLGDIESNFLLTVAKNEYVPLTEKVTFNLDADEMQIDLMVMPIINYHLVGTVKEEGTGLPIEGVKVSILEKLQDGKFREVQMSNTNGSFSSSTLPYEYMDSVRFAVRFEKKGFVKRYVERGAKLGKVDTTELNISMVKIQVGKTDLNEIVKIEPIYFDFNSADIRPDAKVELNKVVEVMKENPEMVIELGSHTDSKGDAKYNLKLSDRRAKASAQYIISQGIPKDRIYGKGYGKSQLKHSDAEISKANSDAAKEKLNEENRRTEFIIMKMK